MIQCVGSTICMVYLTVCSYHVTYSFQIESTVWMSKLPECQRSVYRVWIHSKTCTWHVRTYSQMHRTYKYSQHSSIIWPVWPNGLAVVYELSGCGFESSCSDLNFRFHACFEQGVPWHSGNYRVWIHSETRTWHDKNIQSNAPYR